MEHAHTNYQTLIRAALYLGVFAMIGAGVFARWVGPELAANRRFALGYLLALGFATALGATLYGAWHTVWMLGDTSLLLSYLAETTQGNVLLVRIGLLVALVALGLGWFRLDGWLYPPLAFAMLATLTLTGHSGAVGGLMALASLAHLGFGAAWAGSVVALALCWQRARHEAVLAALRRLSGLGLISVAALSLAGVYLALVQLGPLANLTGSRYGLLLLLKLGIVAAALGLALLNRLRLLPALMEKRTKNLGTVGFEALLIAGILATSGVLASTEPPPRLAAGPQGNIVNFDQTLNGRRYVGQLYADPAYLHFFMDVRDPENNLLPSAPPLTLEITGPEPKVFVAKPINKSQYHSSIPLPGGTYTVGLRLPGETLEYEVKIPGK